MKQEECIFMAIGWPETWSKGAEKFFGWCHDVGIIKDRYFKVGHAALCLIHKETQEVEYFDFGRYTCDKGRGRTRGQNTDPSLKIHTKAIFDEKGKIGNLEDIVNELFRNEKNTHGEGVIYFSLYDKIDYQKTKKFIKDLQDKGSVRYTTFAPNSTNCSRFVAGALMAGGTSTWDKIKLFFTPTLRASPVGTVCDVGYQSNVYRQKSLESPLENFPMGRLGNLKLLWDNVKGNFVGEKVIREDLIEANERPKNVSENAEWLGGLGEGIWIDLREDENGDIRATSYYYDGRVNYDILVNLDENQLFDIHQKFKITYDCSRLFVTIQQNGKKMRLYYKEDVKNKGEEKLFTSVSKEIK